MSFSKAQDLIRLARLAADQQIVLLSQKVFT